MVLCHSVDQYLEHVSLLVAFSWASSIIKNHLLALLQPQKNVCFHACIDVTISWSWQHFVNLWLRKFGPALYLLKTEDCSYHPFHIDILVHHFCNCYIFLLVLTFYVFNKYIWPFVNYPYTENGGSGYETCMSNKLITILTTLTSNIYTTYESF